MSPELYRKTYEKYLPILKESLFKCGTMLYLNEELEEVSVRNEKKTICGINGITD
jgi:hypothetical protein